MQFFSERSQGGLSLFSSFLGAGKSKRVLGRALLRVGVVQLLLEELGKLLEAAVHKAEGVDTLCHFRGERCLSMR